MIHHSDRGVQYASTDYTGLLQQHGIRISMSRTDNPYDNAKAESFIKTLKYEEVYRQEYRDLAEARVGIARFLEKTYNQKRLHSSLGYRPPEEFESSLPEPSARVRDWHEFWRHGEIFSDGDQTEGPEATRKPLPAQRRNEFPVGYSLAGCSPAEPTSRARFGYIVNPWLESHEWKEA